MSKFCTSCGAALEDGAKFCYKCGAKQIVAQQGEASATPNADGQAQQQQAAPVKPAETVEQRRVVEEPVHRQENYEQPAPAAQSGGGAMKIIAGVLVVVAVVVGFLAFSGGDSKKPSKDKAAAAMSVKADEMLDDYIRDQGTAETKYKDKKVNISGKVFYKSEFKNTQNFQIVIAHKSAAGRSYSISLDLPQSKVDVVNSKKVGDFVVEVGTCVGIVKQDKPTDVSVQIAVDR